MALDKITTDIIADDAVTAAKIVAGAVEVDIRAGSVTGDKIGYLGDGTENLSGTIANQQLHFGSAFTLTDNLTVNGDLTLGKVRDDGTGQSITGSGKTLTGTGTLTMGSYFEGEPKAGRVTSLTGQSGVLGSGVTFPTQYAFSASLSTDQSISTSTWTKATLSVSIFGGWDTSNYKFVCPRAGKWQFNFSVRFNDGAFGRFVKLYKNGSAWDQGGSVSYGLSSYTPTIRHAVLVELALNDYIELYVYGSSGISSIRHDDDSIIQTAIQGFLLLG